MKTKKKNLPSRRISKKFREEKRTERWMNSSVEEKQKELMNHRLALKAQLNKEFFADHFEFTLKELEDDVITDEDIRNILATEKENSISVAKMMGITETVTSKRRSLREDEKNLNSLFV